MENTGPTANARRKYLSTTVSALLLENNFDNADKDCIETLTEMLGCFIFELGQSSRNYCELAGRTQPVIGDVIMALVNMGYPLQGIETYAKRENRQTIPPPQQAQVQKQANILQAGTKNPHPSHIPNHLPALPDPHAYIRTPTYKQPVTEYEAIREKAANQKRDIEKALTKFLAKTSETHSLFDTDDNQMFPLIAAKPAFPAYLAALNPTDQVFDFEELEYYYQVANRKEDISDSKDGDEGDDDENEDGKEKKDDQDEDSSPIKEPSQPQPTTPLKTSAPLNNSLNNSPSIDNPYLRAATIPRRVKVDMNF